MGKRIFKYFLWTLASLIGLVIIAVFLLYLPPVQNFAVRKTVEYINRNDSIPFTLSVEKVRLGFPLNLTVRNATGFEPQGDTLFHAGQARVKIALAPLFMQRVEIEQLLLVDGAFHYADTTGSIDLGVKLENLSLHSGQIRLRSQQILIPQLELQGAKVSMELGESPPADTTESEPLQWKIRATELKFEDVDFRMRMKPDEMSVSAYLDEGLIQQATVDLETMEVNASRLELNKDNRFALRLPSEEPPAEGFDPNRIQLSGIRVEIDSIYNRMTDVKAEIRDLAAVERSGLAIRSAQGRIEMDSTSYRAEGFDIKTTSSNIRLDALLGTGITDMSPSTPVDVNLNADLAMKELMLLYPVEDTLKKTFQDERLRIESRITGRLSNLNLAKLQASIPEMLDFSTHGRLVNITDPSRLRGELDLQASLTGTDKLQILLPDSTIRLIPLHVTGEMTSEEGRYTAQLEIADDNSGRIALRGRFNPEAERYRARVKIQDFPIHKMLDVDSLGALSMELTASGRGFDPFAATTEAKVNLQLDTLDYLGFRYQNIALRAELAENNLTGNLTSRNEGLAMGLDLSGRLTEQEQTLRMTGSIDRIDLQRMNFMGDPASVSFKWDVQASAGQNQTYHLLSTMDSIQAQYGFWTNRVPQIVLKADASPNEVAASMQSGDLSLSFRTPTPLDSLLAGIDRTIDSLSAQIAEVNIRPDSLEYILPEFDFRLTAGRNNAINHYMRSRGIGFKELNFEASSSESRPFRVQAELDQFAIGRTKLDTLMFGIRHREENLAYYFRMANKPDNLSELGFIYLYGQASENQASLSLLQRNREKETCVNIGLSARMADSLLTVSIRPENPTISFDQWYTNPGNYLSYNRQTKELAADMKLYKDDKEFSLTSYENSNMPKGSLRLVMRGIEIGPMLSVMPEPIPFEGILNSDMTFSITGPRIAARGSMRADDLVYARNRIGNLDLRMAYQSDSVSPHRGGLKLTLDEKTLLTVSGAYEDHDSLEYRAKAEIPEFPLEILNAFMPDQTANFKGTFHAQAEITGRNSDMRMNGELRFNEAVIRAIPVGTTYRLSDDPILLQNSKLQLNNFAVIAPNDSRLAMTGSLDFADLSRILTDVTVQAKDFRFVDSQRGNMVFGRGSADIYVRAQGTLDALDLRGSVSLLTGTDLTYVMQDSPMDVRDNSQNVVTFVSFADTLDLEPLRRPRPMSAGTNILVDLRIENDVKLSVFLSRSGENRINLIGDGNLTYAMNRQGDTRLSGRYMLSGGTVRYSPPVISPKNFNIQSGGYVAWTGEPLDPTFSLSASETHRTTVTTEDDNSRPVNFRIILKLEGSLREMQTVFDLSAPEDLALQNELASMPPEERSNQAMSLLLYNAYTGPSASAKGGVGNPINSFIAKELNQWAQGALKGVDVSFGIDSYDDPSGAPGSTRTDYSYNLSKRFFDGHMRAVVGGKYSTGDDATENLKNNLVDDITLEYYFSNRDNMFVKVFRHSDFENILEGDVISTGVGFTVRKKMYRFGDLFKLSTEKKDKKAAKKEEREKRREEKKREKQTPLPEESQNDIPVQHD